MQQIDNGAFCKAVEKAHEVGWRVSDDEALSLIMSGSTKTVDVRVEDGGRTLQEMLIIGFYVIARDRTGFWDR